jgi:AcrR family transcriptional regulator
MQDDSTRSRILHAAGEAFAELGFEKATVRDICARAQANVASVNYHFGDKDKLYLETLMHAHRVRKEEFPMPSWPAGTSPEVRLRDFVCTTFQWMIAPGLPWQQQLMMREMMQPTGAHRHMVENFIRPHLGMLLSILQELAPPEIPLPRLHQLAFSVIGQCMFYRCNQHVLETLIAEPERTQYFTPDRLAAHICEVMLCALGRQEFGEPCELQAI